jgi:heme-degrading monooxygenase HmoA
MFAREWKSRCPLKHKEGFIKYLYETGVKDTSATKGYKGSQILTRDLEDKVEIILISYWDTLDSIKAFAGEDIGVAKLYPEDEKYELDPDTFVLHYEVIENTLIK